MRDVVEIQKFLPHRFPFLLVDRIVEDSPSRVVGVKNVTVNEWFFQGHFPGRPIMPGVLILEALAQCGGILFLNQEGTEGKIPFFASIDGAKFRRPVVPGDVLRLELTPITMKKRLCKMKGVASVEGQVAAEVEPMCILGDA